MFEGLHFFPSKSWQRGLQWWTGSKCIHLHFVNICLNTSKKKQNLKEMSTLYEQQLVTSIKQHNFEEISCILTCHGQESISQEILGQCITSASELLYGDALKILIEFAVEHGYHWEPAKVIGTVIKKCLSGVATQINGTIDSTELEKIFETLYRFSPRKFATYSAAFLPSLCLGCPRVSYIVLADCQMINLKDLQACLFDTFLAIQFHENKRCLIFQDVLLPLLQSGIVFDSDPLDSALFSFIFASLYSDHSKQHFGQLLINVLVDARARSSLPKLVNEAEEGEPMEENRPNEMYEMHRAVRNRFPLSLQQCCRFSINSQLPIGLNTRLQAIDTLSLPEILQKFLKC